MKKENSSVQSTVIVSRFLDFWLLGGASVLLWIILVMLQGFRSDYASVEIHFAQIAATFGLLTIVCNHPHFMMSYQLAYSRGIRFVLKHWFCLLICPLAMIGFYTYAYFNFTDTVTEGFFTNFLNRVFEVLGIGFRFGRLKNQGTEILSISIWIMYLTVGWHYSKQVFGCMMVYSRYDKYKISRLQRGLIKTSLFSIAFYNFFRLNITTDLSRGFQQPSYFLGVPLTPIGIPEVWVQFSALFVVLSALGVLIGVFYKNRKQRFPSMNFLISWIAFHVWWIPMITQKEFYFLAIPFFHSLQYLLFVYRMKAPKLSHKFSIDSKFTAKIFVLLVIGFLFFEGIPNVLDVQLRDGVTGTNFFLVCFVVFINVHHFFIDSVIWKFEQKELKDRLFLNS